MAKGNHSNAYATVQPVRNNMADFAIQQERLDIQQDRNKRAEDEADYRKSQREQARIDKMASYQNSVKGIDTGYNNFDEAIADAAQQANDKIYELSKIYSDTSKPEQERIRAKSQMNHLQNNFTSQMKNLSDSYTQLYGEYYKAKEDGSAWNNTDFENFTHSGLKGLKLNLNDDFKFDIFAKDKDGDGVLDVTSVEDFMQLRPQDVIIPKIGIDKLIKERAKTIQPEVNKLYDPKNPYLETEITSIKDQLLEAEVDAILTPTALNSERKRLGLSVAEFTEDIQNELRADVIERLKGQVKGLGTVQDFDAKGKAADSDRDAKRWQDQSQFDANMDLKERKEARMAEAAKNKGRNKDGTVSIDTLKPSHKTTSPVYPGGQPNDDADNNYKYVPKGSRAIPLPEGGIVLKTGDVTEVADNIYIHPDGKFITITGMKSKKGEDNKAFEFTTKRNPSQVNRFIKAGIDGIETHGEFIKHFNNKPKEAKKEEESDTFDWSEQ